MDAYLKDLIAELRQFLIKGDTETALEKLLLILKPTKHELYNEVILLSGQQENIDSQERTGITDMETIERKRNKIRFAILGLLDQIGEDAELKAKLLINAPNHFDATLKRNPSSTTGKETELNITKKRESGLTNNPIKQKETGPRAVIFSSIDQRVRDNALRIDQQATIGRDPDCDIVIQFNYVSRKHARIFLLDGKVFLEDLGSSNGTYVNGERIQKIELLEDCIIHFDEVECKVNFIY